MSDTLQRQRFRITACADLQKITYTQTHTHTIKILYNLYALYRILDSSFKKNFAIIFL